MVFSFMVLLGLTLLVIGGEALVRGATALSVKWGLSPAVVGLTVVAAGTSIPELVVSLKAAIDGRSGMAIGNIVGSNIFNIGFVLGVSALVRPLKIEGKAVRFEWPVLFLMTVLLHLLSRDGTIDRLEGCFFVTSLIGFISYSIYVTNRNISTRERDEYAATATDLVPTTKQSNRPWMANGFAIVIGIVLLAAGAELLVRGAVGAARGLGLSETVIGLVIVGFGTSTPELITSLVALWRGRDDIAVTNVIGSNIFNILGIGGLVSLIHPISVPPEIIARDNWWMIGFALCLFPLMKTGSKVVRWEGLLLLSLFAYYLNSLL